MTPANLEMTVVLMNESEKMMVEMTVQRCVNGGTKYVMTATYSI